LTINLFALVFYVFDFFLITPRTIHINSVSISANARVDRLFALAMGARRPIDGAKSQVERLVRAAKRCGPVGRPDAGGQLARSHREAVRTRRVRRRALTLKWNTAIHARLDPLVMPHISIRQCSHSRNLRCFLGCRGALHNGHSEGSVSSQFS